MGPTIVRLNGIVITQGYDNFKQVDSEYYVSLTVSCCGLYSDTDAGTPGSNQPSTLRGVR